MENEKAENLFGKLNYNTNAVSILSFYDTIGYKTDTIYIEQKNTKRRGANSANTTKNFKIERTPIIENLSSKPLLRTDKPNIIFIVLESFSAKAVEPLGGISGVTPNLNKLFNEGIAFTNFYANSFRTDSGLVSLLSGYPAQHSTSIMNYPSKV